MYCPRCGEEQVSGNLRFCNRCGLPLGLVSEVLDNGGTLPNLEQAMQKKKFFTRRNGVFFSIFWFILFVPFGAAFWDILEVNDLSELSAVFGLFSSILILLFSLFFLGKPTKTSDISAISQNQQAMPQNLSGQQKNQNALPSQRMQPAQDYVSPQAGMWKAPDTGDLVSPGSVTENTTKLLSKEEQEGNTKYLNNQEN